jgi:tetratricopeptide (TPR) repeat protein
VNNIALCSRGRASLILGNRRIPFMKIRSLVLGLLLTAGFGLPQLRSVGGDGETNAQPTAVATPTAEPQVVTVPGLDQLWAQLEASRRANEAASARWSALMEQNNSLSNVLSGLRETLVTQRQREIQISEEARQSNLKVMAGAAAGVFLIFLASYWFQLRCMNRVMELSRQGHTAALPAPAPASQPMLEWESARESKLLDAVKLLENRVQHLEAPPANANGTSTENGHSSEPAVKLIDVGPAEPQPAASKASLLLAKGEILLDMERWQEAVTCFQDAITMDPKNAEAHLKKGIALERMNRLELSLSSYEEAVRLNPNRAFAYVYKARVLAALHRYDEALSVYDSALGKNAPKPASAARVNGR